MTSDLRAAAQAATPGPWTLDAPHPVGWGKAKQGDDCIIGKDETVICWGHWYDEYADTSHENAVYITLASPDRILALLDRDEQMERDRHALSVLLDYEQEKTAKLTAALRGTRNDNDCWCVGEPHTDFCEQARVALEGKPTE